MNPVDTASCSPSNQPNSFRGCPVWTECRFDHKKFGGFKGEGPRNVGYFIQTHEGNKKEDFCSCYSFVSSLQARMDSGISQRQAGRNGEIIRIVAQEGEKITTRIQVPVDERDKNDKREYQYKVKSVTVPAFQRPAQNERLTYDQELAARQADREKRDREIEDAMYDNPERIDSSKGAAAFEPTAEPVKKGPKA
jgi:hypothetical protein